MFTLSIPSSHHELWAQQSQKMGKNGTDTEGPSTLFSQIIEV